MNDTSLVTPELIAHRLPGVEKITIIDMRETVTYTDWKLVCTVPSRHVMQEAVAALRHLAREQDLEWHIESADEWVLIDLGGCIVHLMSPTGRKKWRLELLWGMCAQQDLSALVLA